MNLEMRVHFFSRKPAVIRNKIFLVIIYALNFRQIRIYTCDFKKTKHKHGNGEVTTEIV